MCTTQMEFPDSIIKDLVFFFLKNMIKAKEINLISPVLMSSEVASFFFLIGFFFIQLLKVTFHLQLLQNTGCIPHVVQYIVAA